MPLILTEEQSMLRDSARIFLADNAPVSQLRHLRDVKDAEGYSRSLWGKFAEMGFSGLLVPDVFGGMSMGQVEIGVVMEQIGRNLTASPFLTSSITAVTALSHSGTEAQKKAWLPRLAKSEALIALAIDEKSKHQPAHIALSAKAIPAGFVLNGAKTFVIDGHVADLLIVVARRAGDPGDTEGITLFLVDAKAPGVEIERIEMVDAHNASRITFKQVEVGADAVLGQVDAGWEPLKAALDAARVAIAAELLGVANEVFDRTLIYLKERKQFGRAIGEFQGLQHRVAELYCELENSRSVVLYAQQQLDASKEDASQAVSIAKAHAGRTATLAVQEALQMHGGIGMTDEFDIGLFMKRARVLHELFGDSNFHLNQLALSRGY